MLPFRLIDGYWLASFAPPPPSWPAAGATAAARALAVSPAIGDIALLPTRLRGAFDAADRARRYSPPRKFRLMRLLGAKHDLKSFAIR